MLIDSTLREGAQTFGVYYSEEDKRRIILGLILVGVEEIELGWAGMPNLKPLHRWAEALGSKMFFTVWSPLREKDLQALARCGVRRVHMGVPASDAHIVKRLRLDRREMKARLVRTMAAARDLGFVYISLGLEDVSRADPDFAMRLAETAQSRGADRIRLSDTVGLLTPLRTAELIRRFTSRLDVPVAFHGHNDFGMATANAITALESGAACVDVSVLGVGERAGIAPLEEVCAHLAVVRKESRYSLAAINDLACTVSKAANIPISRIKAVTGEDIFACESGLHLHGLGQDPSLFEPFAPKHVNATRKQGFGTKIGRSAVRCIAQRTAAILSEPELEGSMSRIKRLARQRKRPLSENEAQMILGMASRKTRFDSPERPSAPTGSG